MAWRMGGKGSVTTEHSAVWESRLDGVRESTPAIVAEPVLLFRRVPGHTSWQPSS